MGFSQLINIGKLEINTKENLIYFQIQTLHLLFLQNKIFC